MSVTHRGSDGEDMQRIGLEVKQLFQANGEVHAIPVVGHILPSQREYLLVPAGAGDGECHEAGADLSVGVRHLVDARGGAGNLAQLLRRSGGKCYIQNVDSNAKEYN